MLNVISPAATPQEECTDKPKHSLNSEASDRSRWSFLGDSYELNYNQLINAFHSIAIDPRDGLLAALSNDSSFLVYKLKRECFVQLSRSFDGKRSESEEFQGFYEDLSTFDLQGNHLTDSQVAVPGLQKILSNVRDESKKFLEEKIGEIINKFSKGRDESFEIARKELIEKIGDKKCSKHLVAIAQNCFQLLLKISEKVDFGKLIIFILR